MKKLFICIIMMLCLCVNNSSAQSVVKSGNTFKSVKSTTKGDTLVTKFFFEDNKGGKYPIIVMKKSGRCYVWKKSRKTGKLYKMYMKPEVSKAVCKELGIAYTEKKK